MRRIFPILEELFYKKIMLYQELNECLKEEREHLIKTDMDALWDVSDKKQSILPRIEALRAQILSTLSDASMNHHMDGRPFSLTTVLSVIPHRERERFQKPYLALVNVKAEIEHRSQENKRFVEQSLDFMDELIGILANAGGSNGIYTNNGISPDKGPGNLLLHREV